MMLMQQHIFYGNLLDAMILSACMETFQMESISDEPKLEDSFCLLSDPDIADLLLNLVVTNCALQDDISFDMREDDMFNCQV